MDLVKKIGNWLTRAMALREQMRKCFPANPGNAVSLIHEKYFQKLNKRNKNIRRRILSTTLSY